MTPTRASTTAWRATACGATHRGLVRAENEDAFAVLSEDGIFVVADGIGGTAAGAVASRIAVEVVPAMLGERLAALRRNAARGKVECAVREVLQDVNEAMLRKASEYTKPGEMGTTIVMALRWKASILIAHLGDSRAYHYRGHRIRRLTEDHALAAQLVRWGKITESEAEHNPGKSTLMRYLGAPSAPEPDLQWLMPKPGSRLLLCSDGLTGMLSGDQIARIMNANPSAEACCEALVDRANQAGGKDNITALVVLFDNGAGHAHKKQVTKEM